MILQVTKASQMFALPRISRLSPLALAVLALCGGGSQPAVAQRIAPMTAASVGVSTDPVRLFNEAVGQLRIPAQVAIGTPPARQAFGRPDDGTIVVDLQVVAAIRTPQEALALAAILQSYAVDSPPPLRTRERVSAGEIVAGLLAGAAGSSLNKPGNRYRQLTAGERQALEKRQPSVGQVGGAQTLTTHQVQATRVLTILDKAGGCSAPLATLLYRIADRTNDGAPTAASLFARAVLGDVGAFLQPPDTACLRGR